MPKPAKPQIRVYITEDKDRLLKAISGIKDSSVNAIANEAIAGLEFALDNLAT